jgi:hypothetical protein
MSFFRYAPGRRGAHVLPRVAGGCFCFAAAGGGALPPGGGALLFCRRQRVAHVLFQVAGGFFFLFCRKLAKAHHARMRGCTACGKRRAVLLKEMFSFLHIKPANLKK